MRCRNCTDPNQHRLAASSPNSYGAQIARCRLAVLLLAALAAGCNVTFDAPKVTLLVRDDGISFESAADAARITGGETVLTIRNASSVERQIVLARLGGSGKIPPDLLSAKSTEEDPRIVAITHSLAPAAEDGEPTDSARFHIYLAPGEQHVMFDRLEETPGRVMLKFVPGGVVNDDATDDAVTP